MKLLAGLLKLTARVAFISPTTCKQVDHDVRRYSRWRRRRRGDPGSSAERGDGAALTAQAAGKPTRPQSEQSRTRFRAQRERVPPLSAPGAQPVPGSSPIYMTKTALFGPVSSFTAYNGVSPLFSFFFFTNKPATVLQHRGHRRHFSVKHFF